MQLYLAAPRLQFLPDSSGLSRVDREKLEQHNRHGQGNYRDGDITNSHVAENIFRLGSSELSVEPAKLQQRPGNEKPDAKAQL